MKQPHGIIYYDDISGKVLDTKGVEKARRDEVEIIESFPVWEKIPRHKMPKGTRTIGTRWVDVNKQDEEEPPSSPRGQEGLRF